MDQQWKDGLFHEISQQLSDSMWFLYKQGGTTYEQLLTASREAESEFSKGRGPQLKQKQQQLVWVLPRIHY